MDRRAAYAVPSATVRIISDIIDKRGVFCREKLLDIICEELEGMWPGDEWEKKAAEHQLGTTKQIQLAIDAYWNAINESAFSPELFHNHTVSDGALTLIGEVVRATAPKTRKETLVAVCECLQEKYRGKSLEYHLRQMHLDTTGDILYAIDLYNIGRKYELFEKFA